ncbi:MAG TPA: VOC family protein [Microbacteriaceae bacterium]
MVESITVVQFHEAVPGDEWHRVYGGATAYFVTGSFDKGVAFVNAIARLADALGHDPDIDLRPAGVTVRVMTRETRELTERDVALALQISTTACELGIRSEPHHVHAVQLAIDAMDIAAVLPFWRAVLDYEQVGSDDLVDPRRIGPSVWFQQLDQPRPQRNRIHIDVALSRTQATARIEAALEAGGRIVNDSFAPAWWTLADPEGNEVDIAPWSDDTVWEDDSE